MNNTYIFVIWNRALFCKNRIVDDIAKSFSIVNRFYIEWPKENFENNLKSLYGSKSSNIKDKIKAIGNGKFYIIIFKDLNENFQKLDIKNKNHIINTNVLIKKNLYRKWTAGKFRIHSSENIDETVHDLTIILGMDYLEFETYKTDSTIYKDIFHPTSFNSFDQLIKLINIFGNINYCCVNNKIYFFVYNKYDLLYFFDNTKKIYINNTTYDIYIYGENEGDLPKGFIKKSSNEMLIDFSNIVNDYDAFLINRNNITKSIYDFFNKYSFEYNLFPINTFRKTTDHYSIFDEIKYNIKRLNYCFFKLFF